MALASPIHHRRPTWDVIVVGARCAGSPTAMLLARAGFRVLLVDRAHFPSDSMRCHFIQRPGIEHLSRWGLLPRVRGLGLPANRAETIADLGDFPMAIATGGEESRTTRALCPPTLCPGRHPGRCRRRGGRVGAAGVLRSRTFVWEDGRVAGIRGRTAGGSDIVERAHLVVGADGIYSRVARAVDAATYNERPVATCCYYSYFEDVPIDSDRSHLSARPLRRRLPHERGPDRRRCFPSRSAEFHRFRADIEGAFLASWTRHRRWRNGRRGPTRRAMAWYGGPARILPPLTRSRLGVGRGCRSPQGPDSRQWHQRRLH